ncbi:MAG: hypothetical protein KAT76_07050 [Bacteroidales bacterium]|nr:hypothetical protein [Bacteroidales bacterium]
MNGNLPQKNSYEQSLNRSTAIVLEMLLLMMAGALAAFLHYRLRIPLNMPGHHGLEFMAIFVLIRLGSNIRYAASVATLGVGIFLLIPGMGASNPLNSFGYLLPGLVLDSLYLLGSKRFQTFLLISFIAGFAYMSIPLSRFFATLITAYPYPAFIKFGTAYTILSFFFFGMLGGLLGYGMNSIKTSFRKSNDE